MSLTKSNVFNLVDAEDGVLGSATASNIIVFQTSTDISLGNTPNKAGIYFPAQIITFTITIQNLSGSSYSGLLVKDTIDITFIDSTSVEYSLNNTNWEGITLDSSNIASFDPGTIAGTSTVTVYLRGTIRTVA